MRDASADGHKESRVKGSAPWTLATGLMVGGLLAAPVGAECNITKFGELPVTVESGRVLFNSTINGQNAKFIIDSGAFYSSLMSDSATRLGLPISQLRSRIDIYGLGGRTDARQTTVKTLAIPGVGAALQNVEFLVFGNKFADQADGLLGENILGAADTEYDVHGGVIRLLKSRGCDNTKMSYWTSANDYGVVPMTGRTDIQSVLTAHALLNGVSIAVLFDTGAPQSILSLKAAARAGVTPASPGVIPGGVSSGLGPAVSETYIGKFASFNIGGEEIKNIAMRFGLRESESGEPSMLLGLDFFLSHHMYFAKNQNRLFFTYNGVKIFDLSVLKAANAAGATPRAAPATTGPEPSDAEGYRRRAAIEAANRQWPAAIDDYSQALALRPDDAELQVARGRVRLASEDRAGAEQDFEAALGRAPGNSTIPLQIAYAFEAHRDYPAAISRFNQWAAQYSKDDRLPRMLHERCWCRAAAGVELQQALGDCNEAMSHHNDDSQARVNRGLVWLRLGNPKSAIEDFKVAIEKQPKSPWAFYGRAIAESRNGDSALANEDIKAATDLDATVPEQFRSIGLEPTL